MFFLQTINEEPGKDNIELADPSNIPVDVALAGLDESGGAFVSLRLC